MTPASAKQKGRVLQQWIAELLQKKFNLSPDDAVSRSSGSNGEDIMLSKAARELFPYSIEAKNVEKINVYEAYFQAMENSKHYVPILVIKRNFWKRPLVVLDFEYFVDMQRKINEYERNERPNASYGGTD